MTVVHIGYSSEKDADTLIDMLTVFSGDGQGPTDFERLFGIGHLEPGGYEVYGVEDTQGAFSREELQGLMPFELPDNLQLLDHDLYAAKAVFLVKDPTRWSTSKAGGIVVTDRVEVDRFDYE